VFGLEKEDMTGVTNKATAKQLKTKQKVMWIIGVGLT